MSIHIKSVLADGCRIEPAVHPLFDEDGIRMRIGFVVSLKVEIEVDQHTQLRAELYESKRERGIPHGVYYVHAGEPFVLHIHESRSFWGELRIFARPWHPTEPKTGSRKGVTR